jgi:hypothetical protein
MSSPEHRELIAVLVLLLSCMLNQLPMYQETAMADAWYEVLSVLHLMAMVCLLQANTLLLPRSYGDGYAPRVSEGATTMNCTSEVSLS